MPITRTPWTDDDGSGTTGTVINNYEKQQLYDQIDALVSPPYSTYDAIWKAGGTPFNAGGTKVAYWQRQGGGLIWFFAKFSFDATSVIPNTNGWSVSLPVALFEGLVTFDGLAFNGGSTWKLGSHSVGYGIDCAIMLPYTSPMAAVTNTAPFTWLSGHHITMSGLYRSG